MFGRNPAEPDLSAKGNPEGGTASGEGTRRESDLAELAAKFSKHGGRGMSPELSAGLALDVVLNEIVEQACLATGATGAAVILQRDGEMVCRASSGANAPELGARLSGEPGLTAECIKTKQVQRCDDAQADPRADTEASRSLGVRSVMVLPLLRDRDIAGVLEVFSSRPSAFGERDQLTLEALGQRILKNLQQGSEPLAVAPHIGPAPVTTTAAAGSEDSGVGSTNLEADEKVGFGASEPSPIPGLDFVTIALSLVVLVCAVLLGTLAGFRLGWIKSGNGPGRVNNSAADGVRSSGAQVAKAAAGASSTPAGAGAGNSTALASQKKTSTGPTESFPPEGSLLVYENGKEIFRRRRWRRLPARPAHLQRGRREPPTGNRVGSSRCRRRSLRVACFIALNRTILRMPGNSGLKERWCSMYRLAGMVP